MPLSPLAYTGAWNESDASCVQLGLDGEFTGKIPVNATASDIKAALQNLDRVGYVDVDVEVYDDGTIAEQRWAITFLQNLNKVSLLEVVEYETSSTVARVREGTTSNLRGDFTLTLGSSTTSALSVYANKTQVFRALSSLGVYNLANVKRYDNFNNSIMFLIEFDDTEGDVPTLVVNGRNLAGTHHRAEVTTFQDGSKIGGFSKLQLTMKLVALI